MSKKFNGVPAVILIAEDNDADMRLTEEALLDGKINTQLNRVKDGVEAMSFMRREPPYEDAPRPDIVLLDLNMPRMDGREVMEEMSKDENLMTIPVVVLTTSEAEADIVKSYRLKANCYITKPVDFNQFVNVVKSIEHFWFSIVRLPEFS